MKGKNRKTEVEAPWRGAADPNWCWTVTRRKFADDVLYTLGALAETLMTRGRSLTWGPGIPRQRAYQAAVQRLKKQGLVAYRKTGGKTPGLFLTAEGDARLEASLRPEPYWQSPWDGTWYVLVFDVPERHRGYRFALRGFLNRMRMGGLQRSVWVSPRDIRPAYKDLDIAASVKDCCFLLQSRTVLGQPPGEIVARAWPMDVLRSNQEQYLRVFKARLLRLKEKPPASADLHALLREERIAYLSAMEKDPLLPESLWPAGYLGRQVYSLHRILLEEIGRRL